MSLVSLLPVLLALSAVVYSAPSTPTVNPTIGTASVSPVTPSNETGLPFHHESSGSPINATTEQPEAMDMDCHKDGSKKSGPKQHALGQPGDVDGDVKPGHHVIEKRAAVPEKVVFDNATETPTGGNLTEIEDDLNVDMIAFDKDVCNLASHNKTIDIDSVPQMAELDPMNFTIAGYKCSLEGFSDIKPLHTNCTPVGDHLVFFGHFAFDLITCNCDCGHQMANYPYMVQVNITNTQLHARIHKHTNGKFMYFYDTKTYARYSEVDAPFGSSKQMEAFLDKLHKDLRAHFEMAYVDVTNILLKLISKHL